MKKNLLLSLFSAVLFSISWPTYGFPFFIFIAFVPLLILENNIVTSNEKRKGLRIYFFSYITFCIWNIFTTGWLYNALNPDGSNSLMAVMFPVIVNSLLMSTTFFFYHLYKMWNGKFPLVFLTLIWLAFEYLHLSWEFTWPWLNLGNVFADYHQVIQWYDTFGSVGGSVWILVINVIIFKSIYCSIDIKKKVAVISTLIILPIIISLWKYNTANPTSIGKVKVALLQPKLDPYLEKYEKSSKEIVTELLQTTDELNNIHVDFYFAPETAIPGRGHIDEDFFDYDPSVDQIQNFISTKNKSIFITGASTYKIHKSENEIEETSFYNENFGKWMDSYNSALQIDSKKNEKIQVYHKAKLVPGVEIFPYINILKPILGDAMLNMGGAVISLGGDKERKVFTNVHNKAKVAPIICYESIYGEYTTEYVKNGANLLSIITNDSWWGHSQGHKQLLAYAKLRAIENRREIVRSANSGISAHINAKGDIIKTLAYDIRGILYVEPNLHEDLTFYTKYSQWIQRILNFSLIIFLVHFVFINLQRKISSKKELK